MARSPAAEPPLPAAGTGDLWAGRSDAQEPTEEDQWTVGQ